MADITESAIWEESVYELSITDPVKGGTPIIGVDGSVVSGHANVQAQKLANRTKYLKQKLDGLPDSVDAAGTAASLVTSHNTNPEAHPELVSMVSEEADRATLEADRAQAAADSASLSSGVYPDTAAGLASTTSGEYFSVPSTDDTEFLILYRNNSGVATEQKKYPSSKAVNSPSWAGQRNGWPDPFFRYSEIDVDFLGKPRWHQPGIDSLTFVNNPVFSGRALRKTVGAVSDFSGPRVYLSDMGAVAGDKITVRALIVGTGQSVRLSGNALDESGATIGSAYSTVPPAITVGPTPTLFTLEVTTPALTDSFYIRPTTTTVGDVFDIVAFWACKGAASTVPTWPNFTDDTYATILARNNNQQIVSVVETQNSQSGVINTLDQAVTPFVSEVFENYAVTISTGYLSKTTGALVPSGTSYRSTQQIACSPTDEIYVTVWSQSSLMASICYYNSTGDFIGYELGGTGTGTPHTDYKLTIPQNAAFFALCGYNVFPPSGKKFITNELDVFSRQQSDSRYVKSGNIDSSAYGIRWEIASSNSTCERTGDAVGLTSQTVVGTGSPAGVNSFDSIYPWSHIRRCAIKTLPSGATKLLYEGELGYSEDGSAGDIYYEIPRFGYERKIVDGYEYRTISRNSFDPHPAFIEPSGTLDAIYVSAYNASELGGVLQSLPNTLPTMNQFPQAYLDKAVAKGRGHTLLDMRTIDAIQNLMWIEHATRNSSNIIGHGWAELKQARVDTWKFVLSETSVNRFVMEQAITANNKEQLFIGQDIIICDTDQTNIIARRKIVSVEYDSPSVGQTVVTFDGDPINTTTNMFAGSCPQQTGQTDVMAYHTGRLDRPKAEPTSTIARDELNPNRYRGIENLTGEVWRLLPDVTYNDGQMYICKDITSYQFHKVTDQYKPIALDVPIQESNSDGYWVGSLGFDNLNPKIAVADSIVAGSDTNYFGAFHYLNPGAVIIAHGGGFDHKKRCNILTYRAWITPTTQWYLYGARLQFKPI